MPAKGVANESIQLANTQQQEKKKDTSLAKQKRPDGKPVGRVVYLTFDDGPGKYTAELLDMLKKENAKATFFLIGSNVKA
ncbi:polysaccharide deacetylase family protein, partial [Bacillus vallismortis]|nr:polysaccharide deacetylase family protein [Bacillus vallismortis]